MSPEQPREKEEVIAPQETAEQPKERIITYTENYKDRVASFYDEIENNNPEVKGAKDVRNVPEYYQKDEASNFWLAIGENDDVVGTIGLINKQNGIGYLERLYVREALRGRGIGSRLFEAAKDFAKEKGYKTLFGATMPGNDNARKLYDRLGMKIVETPPPTSMRFREGTIFVQYDLESKVRT